MYSAPDFVKVELMQNGVFASACKECVPGTKLNDVDWGGPDLSGCQYETILGETDSWECYYVHDEDITWGDE